MENWNLPLTYYLVLAHCARNNLSEAEKKVLVDKTKRLRDWNVMPDYARWHGMAPLLYHHFRDVDLEIPLSVARELQFSFVQTRQQNQIRLSVLDSILDVYNSAGIRALVLKGAALSLCAYSSTGLRPMRDIDILVSPSSVVCAQESLRAMGFHASTDDLEFRLNHHHHLEPAWKTVDGLFVSVEIHHGLAHGEPFDEEQFDRLIADSQLIYRSQALAMRALGHEDMLAHLCRHLIQNTTVFSSPRLIWLADIVTYAEKHVAEIDWYGLRKRSPLVLNMLSLIYHMTPLSQELRSCLAQHTLGTLNDVGRDFRGWPRTSLEEQMEKGLLRFLGDTFWPSEWWLRLHSGLDSAQSIWWQRLVAHPAEIISWIQHWLSHKPSRTNRETLG